MEAEYFKNYCGYGPYDANYLFHSGIKHCTQLVDRMDLRVRSIAVLGAATGRVLEHFDAAWGIRPWGCEISSWAHERIPGRYRRRIRCADMRDYLKELESRGREFDLIFSNALVYLEASEVEPFLARCARLSRHFHFWSSTSEDYERGDRRRVTLRPRAWWRERFLVAGFVPTRSRYLWRSARRSR